MSSFLGGAYNAPSKKLISAISDSFPTPNRSFKVESGIEKRHNVDYLPINANIQNSSVNDTYVEFLIHPTEKTFLNLDKIFLELKLQIRAPNNANLTATNHSVTIIEGVGTSLISRCNVFLNSTPVESNAYMGLWDYIRTSISMTEEERNNAGRVNFYRNNNTDIPRLITADYFTEDNLNDQENEIIGACRDTIHTMIPLKISLSTADVLLVDNITLKIRIDFNPSEYILLTHQDIEYSYRITLAKLHIENIVVEPNALISLNSNMLKDNSQIEYLFEKPVIKTQVITTGLPSVICDNVFTGQIPSTLYVFMIAQNSLNGAFNRNPLYLENCNVNKIKIDVNGSTCAYLTGDFQRNLVSEFMMKTLSAANNKLPGLTYDNFRSGKTIFVFDLCSSLSNDTLTLDRQGSLRLEFSMSSATTENHILFMVGLFNNSLLVNAARSVEGVISV